MSAYERFKAFAESPHRGTYTLISKAEAKELVDHISDLRLKLVDEMCAVGELQNRQRVSGAGAPEATS